MTRVELFPLEKKLIKGPPLADPRGPGLEADVIWRGEAPPPQASPAKRQGEAAAGAAGEATPTKQGAGVLIPSSRSLWTSSPGAGDHVGPKPGHVRASRGWCLLAELTEWETRQEVGGRRRRSGELRLRQRLGPPSRSSGGPGGLGWIPSPHQRLSLSCYSSDKADPDITTSHLHPERSGWRKRARIERRPNLEPGKDKKEPEPHCCPEVGRGCTKQSPTGKGSQQGPLASDESRAKPRAQKPTGS